jgi:hypothetical protein
MAPAPCVYLERLWLPLGCYHLAWVHKVGYSDDAEDAMMTMMLLVVWLKHALPGE